MPEPIGRQPGPQSETPAEPSAVMQAATAEPLLAPEIDRAAIEALPPEALVMRYRRGLALIDGRAFDLDDELADTAFLGAAGVGSWPVRVAMGHLADGEQLFRWWLMRLLSEDGPVLDGWDPQGPIDGGLYGGGVGLFGGRETIRPPVGSFAALVYTVREATAAMLIQLPAEAWDRRGLHPQLGELSVRAALGLAVWHLEHHARFVNAKVWKLLGPPVRPQGCGGDGPCEPGGCGEPGCSCVPAGAGGSAGG